VYSFAVFPEPIAFGLDGGHAGGGGLVVGVLVRHVDGVGCDRVRETVWRSRQRKGHA
jgi:hypothetical protein